MLESILFVMFTMIYLALFFAKPVFADLKCGDAPPAEFGTRLVIAWTGPVPSNARISAVDRAAFDRVPDTCSKALPDTLPARYTKGFFESDIFNSSIANDADEAVRWHQRYGMTLGEGPLGLFQEYLREGNFVISQHLVEHPPVVNFRDFLVCSVAFQRADIWIEDGEEHLFLRSSLHSHSQTDKEDFANFGPAGGLRISFETSSIWYPLRVTKLNGEPTLVVLNIFADKPLESKQLPSGFEIQNTGWVQNEFSRSSFTTLTATFEGGQDVPDLNIPL